MRLRAGSAAAGQVRRGRRAGPRDRGAALRRRRVWLRGVRSPYSLQVAQRSKSCRVVQSSTVVSLDAQRIRGSVRLRLLKYMDHPCPNGTERPASMEHVIAARGYTGAFDVEPGLRAPGDAAPGSVPQPQHSHTIRLSIQPPYNSTTF